MLGQKDPVARSGGVRHPGVSEERGESGELGGGGLRMSSLTRTEDPYPRARYCGIVDFALCNLMVQCALEQPCRHFCNLMTLMTL